MPERIAIVDMLEEEMFQLERVVEANPSFFRVVTEQKTGGGTF